MIDAPDPDLVKIEKSEEVMGKARQSMSIKTSGSLKDNLFGQLATIDGS